MDLVVIDLVKNICHLLFISFLTVYKVLKATLINEKHQNVFER